MDVAKIGNDGKWLISDKAVKQFTSWERRKRKNGDKMDQSIGPTASQAAQSRQPCVNSHQLSQWEALGTVIFDPQKIDIP